MAPKRKTKEDGEISIKEGDSRKRIKKEIPTCINRNDWSYVCLLFNRGGLRRLRRGDIKGALMQIHFITSTTSI
jgi:hypothetical protein